MRRALLILAAAAVAFAGLFAAFTVAGASAHQSMTTPSPPTTTVETTPTLPATVPPTTAPVPTAPATTAGTTTAPTNPTGPGPTVRLRSRVRTSGCVLGSRPDRRCSPGAYYAGLTTALLCSPSLHTIGIQDVHESETHAVEAEYGLAPRHGRSLEIDHIISVDLGGSNDIANLFPEKAPGDYVKDKLENRLHQLVCSGAMNLHAAQIGIAGNWQALYKRVFGIAPSL